MWTKQNWRSSTLELPLREHVWDKYNQFVAKCEWNKDIRTHILPAVHGTDIAIANAISETGFAALSSLDAGFFGKGIYFTTHSLYTLPYICSKRNPALILSWILPGNSYPVIEQPDGPNTLCGGALKNGCNSHFIVTTKAGKPPTTIEVGAQVYDEIMIPQEAQIVPAFILELEPLAELAEAWLKR